MMGYSEVLSVKSGSNMSGSLLTRLIVEFWLVMLKGMASVSTAINK